MLNVECWSIEISFKMKRWIKRPDNEYFNENNLYWKKMLRSNIWMPIVIRIEKKKWLKKKRKWNNKCKCVNVVTYEKRLILICGTGCWNDVHYLFLIVVTWLRFIASNIIGSNLKSFKCAHSLFLPHSLHGVS